jgi:hypothetical protein
MKRTILTVAMGATRPDEEPDEQEIPLLLGDQMRGELEIGKRGLSPERNGINFLAACAWSAMVREGRTQLGYDDFVKDCYDVSQLDEDEELDPTQRDPLSDSSSPWSSPTPEPATTGGETESTPVMTG